MMDNLFDEVIFYKNVEEVTRDEFKIACSKAESLKDLCRILQIRPHKDVNAKLKELSYKFGTPLPVWQTRTKPQRKTVQKLTVDERLSYGRYIKGSALKKVMIGKGVPLRCSNVECPLHTEDKWCGKDITLQVDHIDGDNINNVLENLRFLCPNCNSQTSTFSNKRDYVDCECGRRRLKDSECPHRKNGQNDVKNLCECGALKSFEASYCRKCSDSKRVKK